MNHVINHLFNLLKSGYFCKRNIKKCLKNDKSSPSYRFAKSYDEHFTQLEKRHSLTLVEVEMLIHQLEAERIENKGSEDVQRLLSSILAFFEELKHFINEKSA